MSKPKHSTYYTNLAVRKHTRVLIDQLMEHDHRSKIMDQIDFIVLEACKKRGIDVSQVIGDAVRDGSLSETKPPRN
jgi:hypothetical protein